MTRVMLDLNPQTFREHFNQRPMGALLLKYRDSRYGPVGKR